MILLQYPWIDYDCSKVPNEFRCMICGEKMIITTPARYSTLMVLGDKFASQHRHEKNKEKTNVHISEVNNNKSARSNRFHGVLDTQFRVVK